VSCVRRFVADEGCRGTPRPEAENGARSSLTPVVANRKESSTKQTSVDPIDIDDAIVFYAKHIPIDSNVMSHKTSSIFFINVALLMTQFRN
jgi:hypothetical protein